MLDQYAGQGFGVFKPALADLTVDKLRPVSDLMHRYLGDPDEIDRIFAAGADRAKCLGRTHSVRYTKGHRIFRSLKCFKAIFTASLTVALSASFLSGWFGRNRPFQNAP